MLRFVPDDWLDGLLRPLILADPSAGIYFEDAAPDWRVALLALFGLVAVLAGRRRGRPAFEPAERRALAMFAVAFYVWTFVIGNGRYFAFGLLLVGPLLVAAWRRLPGSQAFRALLLVGAAALQIHAVVDHYRPNGWGLARWYEAPGLSIEASPLLKRPAVFLTLSGISYSILVPAFHPASRWANVSGQRDVVPGMPEFGRLQRLLESGLPRYLVAPFQRDYATAQLQPVDELRRLFGLALAPHGVDLDAVPCTLLRSPLVAGSPRPAAGSPPEGGFWLCPLMSRGLVSDAASTRAVPERLRRAFAAVEGRCPRFFPAGNGEDRFLGGVAVRHYGRSDMRLYASEGDGKMAYRYFRALNPTSIGSVEAVLDGRFRIECERIDGRYRPPWARD